MVMGATDTQGAGPHDQRTERPHIVTTGDCFPRAAEVAAEVTAMGYAPLIVHGIVTGSAGEVAGRPYWHAWVELQLPGEGWMVADWSNGKGRSFIARRAYYRAGKVQQHQVWRFSPAQALAALDRYGHAGPWHPHYDTLGEATWQESLR